MPRLASDIPLMSKQRNPTYSMTKEHNEMPLNTGEKAKTKKGFSENVATEINAGKPRDQSVAIAYSEAGEHKKHKSHSSTHRYKEHR